MPELFTRIKGAGSNSSRISTREYWIDVGRPDQLEKARDEWNQSQSRLAIIPARGGSKVLPRKNILPLCGKPLIAWTIEAAIDSEIFDQITVSTDCPEIQRVASAHGASAPFLRPSHLATDTATSVEVVPDCLERYSTYEWFCLLQPTSPL